MEYLGRPSSPLTGGAPNAPQGGSPSPTPSSPTPVLFAASFRGSTDGWPKQNVSYCKSYVQPDGYRLVNSGKEYLCNSDAPSGLGIGSRRITVSVTFPSQSQASDEPGWAGVRCRISDGAKYQRDYRGTVAPNGQTYIKKHDGKKVTTLETIQGSAAQTRRLSFECRDQAGSVELTLRVDNETTLQVIDSSPNPRGGVGLMVESAGSKTFGAVFTDLVVQRLP